MFLNAHGVEWRGNPDYASWRFGEVVDDVDAVLAAVRRAQARHAGFLPVQRDGVDAALGRDWAEAPARAAALFGEFLLRDRPELRVLPPRIVAAPVIAPNEI